MAQQLHKQLAVVEGSTDQPLWHRTLGDIIHERAKLLDSKTAVIFPWQGVRLSYRQLAERARMVATALLQASIKHSDCIGVMAGNRYEYLEVVLGGALIGCPVLVLNNTYKPWELQNALQKTSCQMLFIAPTIGSRSLTEHLKLLTLPSKNASLPGLSRVVTFGDFDTDSFPGSQAYDRFLSPAQCPAEDIVPLEPAHGVAPSDVLSLQFTSGTTGEPKASMLTHINLLNNARFLGQQMELIPEEVVCCAPPLFHCFGLVMAFFSTIIHGATIVFPSDHFDPGRVLDSIDQERCTTLLGVPTMFAAELDLCKQRGYRPETLSKGLVAGSPVSPSMMVSLQEHMGIEGMVISYGMTETSTITFSTSLRDSIENRTRTVGQVMPHVTAKIINERGETLGRGERGEMCISGYAVQKGYLNNPTKTNEVMKKDNNGTLWMHTGDECLIDEEGYCHVLGRIKDIIIRGGENIFPKEIEERLQHHPRVIEASVVGVSDAKYGEVVGCFLRVVDKCPRPQENEIQDWVQISMGRSKTPQYVFWVGPDGACPHIPQTGSGKHQKHLLQQIAAALVSGH